MQIFSSPPRAWKSSTYSKEEMGKFREKVVSENLTPVFVHAVYLINLASDNAVIRDRSINALIADMQFAERVGAEGVIFHLGSHRLGWSKGKRDELINHFESILRNTPENTLLIVENSAGSGNRIGGSIEELAKIRKDIKDDRLKFCLDTAHLFQAGYDISKKKKLAALMNKIGRTLRWSNVVCIHANDSKTKLGSRHDVHENIGEGKIGKATFKRLFEAKELKDTPFIIETPGFKNKGPDKKNIDILKGLV